MKEHINQYMVCAMSHSCPSSFSLSVNYWGRVRETYTRLLALLNSVITAATGANADAGEPSHNSTGRTSVRRAHLHQVVPKRLEEKIGSLPDRQLPILRNLQKKQVTRQHFGLALPYVDLGA